MIQTAIADSRRERRKQEYRDRILQAAMALFEQQGCDVTTLDDICREADISRPTFYKYYANKQELIQALGETLWLNLAQELTSDAIAQAQSVQAYIEGFFDLIRVEFAKYSSLERELVRHIMISDNSDAHSIHIMLHLTQMFAEVFQKGKEQGQITSDDPIDFLAEMTMGSINAVMMNWASIEDYPINQRLDQLAVYIPKMLKA